MNKRFFLSLPNGSEAHVYELHAGKIRAAISDWGGTVLELYVPDREGKLHNVVLSHRDPAAYFRNMGCLGAIVGRVANRIVGGRFVWDGVTYQTVLNGANLCTLHGGFNYGMRLWDVVDFCDDRLVLHLYSPDGDAGFPGALEIEAEYRLLECGALELTMRAVSDAPAPVDLTNHMYFNLNGEESGFCDDHVITLAAAKRLIVDDHVIPTGEVRSVEGTVYDLRKGRRFSEIRKEIPRGLDNTFILGDRFDLWQSAGNVYSPSSGIRLQMNTFSPGVIVYMAGHFDGVRPGRSIRYPQCSGFCLEAQGWPGSLNYPDFPSIRLEPGETWLWRTRYSFTAEE